MNNANLGIKLYLLQNNYDYFRKQSNKTDITLGICVAIIVIALIVMTIVKKRGGSPSGSSPKLSGSKAHRYSGFALKRMVSGMDLSREQIRMLDYVFKHDNVADPSQSFASMALLDQHFEKTYRFIEQNSSTEEEAQQRLSVLFSTRNAIETHSGADNASSAQPGKASAERGAKLTHPNQRRFRRKQIVLPVSFYMVNLEASGRQNKPKLVVDKKRLTGSIMDISAGGCSIKTSAAVTSGMRLKIETAVHGNSIAALGQTLRTNRTGISTIIHIKFLRVPTRSTNVINALAYEYIDA
jgi:hypothetical protein